MLDSIVVFPDELVDDEVVCDSASMRLPNGPRVKKRPFRAEVIDIMLSQVRASCHRCISILCAIRLQMPPRSSLGAGSIRSGRGLTRLSFRHGHCRFPFLSRLPLHLQSSSRISVQDGELRNTRRDGTAHVAAHQDDHHPGLQVLPGPDDGRPVLVSRGKERCRPGKADCSPGHNVVVGRNGSGKSNFFSGQSASTEARFR